MLYLNLSGHDIFKTRFGTSPEKHCLTATPYRLFQGNLQNLHKIGKRRRNECQRITTPSSSIQNNGTKQYDSQWKLILQEYNALLARLMNSQHVLENINITLFNINKITLRLWFKDKTRTDEIITLMQDRHVPKQCNIATDPLFNVREKPCNKQGTTTALVITLKAVCAYNPIPHNYLNLVFSKNRHGLSQLEEISDTPVGQQNRK